MKMGIEARSRQADDIWISQHIRDKGKNEPSWNWFTQWLNRIPSKQNLLSDRDLNHILKKKLKMSSRNVWPV